METSQRQQRFLLFFHFRFIGNSVSPHQQSVAVHPVRGTGKQRHQVFSLFHSQVPGILRLHHGKLVHLIGQRIVQNMQEEMISLLQLIQICE